MPMDMQLRGGRFVHVSVPWPPECRLKLKPASVMTEAEMKAEIRADKEGETALHKSYCQNVDCPAKR